MGLDVDAPGLGRICGDAVEASPSHLQQVYLSPATLHLEGIQEVCLPKGVKAAASASWLVLPLSPTWPEAPRLVFRLQFLQERVGDLHCSIARGVYALVTLGKEAKKAVRTDGCRYLAGVADPVEGCRMICIARFVARSRLRAPAGHALKALCPVFATDYESRCRRCWQSHFAEQEAGQVVDEQGYIEGFFSQKTFAQQVGRVFDLNSLPTLMEIEQALLALLPKHKAAGADTSVCSDFGTISRASFLEVDFGGQRANLLPRRRAHLPCQTCDGGFLLQLFSFSADCQSAGQGTAAFVASAGPAIL